MNKEDHQEEIFRISEKIQDVLNGENVILSMEALIMTTAMLNKAMVPAEHRNALFESMRDIQKKLFEETILNETISS